MENQTQFNLEDAICGWRHKLNQSPAFGSEDLAELEGHLRESVNRLRRESLSAEEAFLIAVRRLGRASELEIEFGKENTGAVWIHRGLWMLAGIQLACTILMISRVIMGGLLLGWHALFPPNHPWGQMLGISISLGALIGWIVFSWVMIFRKSEVIANWFGRMGRRPILLGFQLMMLGLLLYVASFGLSYALLRGFHDSVIVANAPQQWTASGSMLVQVFILPAALAWLLRKRSDLGQRA